MFKQKFVRWNRRAFNWASLSPIPSKKKYAPSLPTQEIIWAPCSLLFSFWRKIPCPKVWHSPFNDFWGDSMFIWLFIYQSFFVSQNSLRTYLISLCKQRPLHWYPFKLEYPTIAPTNGHRYPVPSPQIQHADTNTQLTDTLDQLTDSRLWYWNREIN